MATRPIAEGLFTESPEPPALIGSRCASCGHLAFPTQRGCGRCGVTDVGDELLPTEGHLWTWTVQAFQPKEPYIGGATPFEPYGVGYVDLAGEILVETRLTCTENLKIGMAMRLCLEPLGVDESGSTVVTFAFEPAA